MVDVVAMGALLARALPYLLQSADHVASRASAALGGATWEFAQRIWARLGERINERPAALEAVEDVAAAPDDAGARLALERQLSKVLAADAELAGEVDRLMGEAARAGVVRVAGDRNVTIGGAPITNAAIITGDGNTIGRS